MKSQLNHYFLSLVIIMGSWTVTKAQQKTLAVGTTTTNPNAALHVESPTNNQGAIMPRLTTAQRTAMTGILGAPDAGLLLYDTDLKGLYIWNGTAWESSAKLAMPFKDSVVTATGTTDLFALKYNNAENKRVMRIENLNRSNGSSAVSISNNGSGLGLYVQNTSDTSSSSAIYATHNSNNLTANPNPVAVYGEATGTAGTGASFRITNAANNRTALYSETVGVGPTFVARQSGGNGNAGYFWVSNVTNGGSSVYARNDGTGAAINGITIGTGYAASFENSNPGNTNPTILAQTNGLGPVLQASHTNGGFAIDIAIGGFKNSFITESTPGELITRAGVINIDVAGTYTLSTAGRVNGETIIITSEVDMDTVTIDLGGYQVSLYNNKSSATFVFVNGTWRGTGAFAP